MRGSWRSRSTCTRSTSAGAGTPPERKTRPTDMQIGTKRNLRPIAALAAAAGLAAAPDSQASNTINGTCDARPAAGSTLSLCDFTPAANGETIAQATFEVQ